MEIFRTKTHFRSSVCVSVFVVFVSVVISTVASTHTEGHYDTPVEDIGIPITTNSNNESRANVTKSPVSNVQETNATTNPPVSDKPDNVEPNEASTPAQGELDKGLGEESGFDKLVDEILENLEDKVERISTSTTTKSTTSEFTTTTQKTSTWRSTPHQEFTTDQTVESGSTVEKTEEALPETTTVASLTFATTPNIQTEMDNEEDDNESSMLEIENELEEFEEMENNEIADESNDYCLEEQNISEFCILPEDLETRIGNETTFNDIMGRIFSNDVIEMLMKCESGGWCLGDEANDVIVALAVYWTDGDMFGEICWPGFDDCLHAIADYFEGCEQYKKMDLVARSAELLCEMSEVGEENLSSPCVTQTLKLLHVTMADISRISGDQEVEHEEQEGQSNSCDTDDVRMVENLLCVESTCANPLYNTLLVDFPIWEWFSSKTDDIMERCNITDQHCFAASYVAELTESGYAELMSAWRQYDLVIGLTLASIASLAVLTTLAVVFWKRFYIHRHLRFKDGVEYMEINADEEKDMFKDSNESDPLGAE